MQDPRALSWCSLILVIAVQFDRVFISLSPSLFLSLPLSSLQSVVRDIHYSRKLRKTWLDYEIHQNDQYPRV